MPTSRSRASQVKVVRLGGIGQRGKVAVGVRCHLRVAKDALPVGGVVHGARDRVRQERARKSARDPETIARGVVAIRQAPEVARVVAIDQRGERRRDVVLVLGVQTVGQRQQRPPASVVVLEPDGLRALEDLGQARGRVVGVGRRYDAGDVEPGPPPEGVVLVADGPQRRALREEPVEDVVGVRQGAAD